MGTQQQVLEPFKGDAFAGLREQVATLFSLGQAQATGFEGEIAAALRASRGEGADHQMLPIEGIVASRSAVHGYPACTTREQMAEAVRAGLRELMPGDGTDLGWATAFVVKMLSRLLESGEPSGEKRFHFPLIDGLSIVRLDLKARYADVSAPELRQAVEKIVVVAAVKSVVDLNAFDSRGFLAIYQHVLLSADVGPREIEREVERAVVTLRKLKAL
ncbi:hypothetical protein [Burkholderia plantarii]|uniref:hypothetical protein n=1 Tax=Burkholderia plantarii TaxID=41899 RepID=UPI0018DC71A8|nr:hypothetical protein [Burkholderia plantarii]MBI0331312.1 hypothetical protein [Burkholderia plantarii]